MTSNPRILLYSDAYMSGGAEQYFLELARGLPRKEFRVAAVASTESAVDGFVAQLRDLEIQVQRLRPIHTLKQVKAFTKALRYFAFNRHDLVHFNLVDPRACNGAITAAAATLHSRLIVTEHLPHSPMDSGPLPLRHRLTARATKATIVNSEAHRQMVMARPGNKSRVIVIPNGMFDPGAPTPERRLKARAALDLAGSRGPVVGFVARLQPQKNPHLFLEGVRRVAAQHPDAVFAVIGDGDLHHEMEARVAELELGDAVRFYGWRDDSADLMYGLDLLVNTSIYEGQPLSILEAMLRGVPVVAQKIAGIEDLVADQASGRVVAPQDGDALGEALSDVLRTPERLAHMGRAARQRTLTLFSIESMVRATTNAYRSLLE